jgi:Zn-dependent protease
MDLADGINWYVVFLFSTCCHEAAHAWTASRLGDDTARAGGQVSLDPLPHIRRAPFGMVVVPILFFATSGTILGWANAPYSVTWARTYPRRCAAMALAGPLANILLAVLAVLLIRVGCEWGVLRVLPQGRVHEWVSAVHGVSGIWIFVAKILGITFRLNLLLAVFNLLPFPPLDGGNLPLFFLPRDVGARYWAFLNSPNMAWVGLLAAYRLLDLVLPHAYSAGETLLRMIGS